MKKPIGSSNKMVVTLKSVHISNLYVTYSTGIEIIFIFVHASFILVACATEIEENSLQLSKSTALKLAPKEPMNQTLNVVEIG